MKLLKIIFLIIFCLNIKPLSAQTKISNPEERYYLQFKILESNIEIGKFINGSEDSLGFKSYDGKKTPFSFPMENRMLTIRSEFFIDESLFNEDFTLVFPPVFYACNIYLNGRLIEKRGNIEGKHTGRIHYTESYFIPKASLFFGDEKPNKIGIELLSKQGDTSPAEGIFVSGWVKGTTYTFWRNFWAMTVLKGMVVAVFLIFIYILLFSILQRKLKRPYYLPFSIACLFFGLSYFNNILNYEFSNNYLLELIVRASFNLWSFFTLYYILEYTRITRHKNKILVVALVSLLTFTAFNLLQPNAKAVSSFFSTYVLPLNLLVDISIFIIAIIYFIRKPNLQSFLILGIYFLTIIAIGHDVYYTIILQVKPYVLLVNYVMFLSISVFFAITAWEQSEVYIFAQQKKKELEEINQNLEFIVKERTSKVLETEKQFRSIFEFSTNAIFLLGKNGEYFTVNPAFIKLTGYSLEDLRNKTAGFMTHPDNLDEILNTFKGLRNSEIEEYACEIRILTKHGYYIWINLQASLYINLKNEFEYVLCSFSDITEHKNAQLKIEESERIHRFMIENINDVIWTMDLETEKFTYLSPSIEKLTGHTVEEVMNQSLNETFTAESVAAIQQTVKEKLSGFQKNPEIKVTYVQELEQYCKNGKTVWMETHANFHFNKITNHFEILGVSRDISIRKIQEALIRKLSTAVEQNPASIVITDINGNIEYANPRFEELTGYSLEEVKGQNPKILSSGKSTSETYIELWSNISNGKIWKGEFINKRKNGEEFTESALVSPIFDDNDKIINYLAIKEDITLIKQQEAAIHKYLGELKELNATKDKFFSIIAHDLRNPFAAILGLTDIVIGTFDELAANEIKGYIKDVNISANNAYKLLENLLEWARSQSDKIDYNLETLNLKDLFNEAISGTESAAINKSISVINDLDSNIEFISDRNMVNTVLRNLINNALKFTHKKGRVTLRGSLEDKNVYIAVSDTGVGIDPETIKKLFRVSEKVTKFGTENERGTGLGLLICKDFIEKLNGSIWVESEVGKGSEFKIKLPLDKSVS